MRQNISALHHLQNIVNRIAPRILRMHHNGQPSRIGRLSRSVQRQHPGPLADNTIPRQSNLHPENNIAVLFNHAAGLIDIRVFGNLELADLGSQHTLRRNIHLCQNPRLTHIDHVLPKSRKNICTRRSRIDHSRRASRKTRRVGFDTKMADTGKYMDVNIDQPRRHHTIRRVNHLAGIDRIQIFPNSSNPAPCERHIPHAAEAFRRIDQRPALDEQIVRHRKLPSHKNCPTCFIFFLIPMAGI